MLVRATALIAAGFGTVLLAQSPAPTSAAPARSASGPSHMWTRHTVDASSLGADGVRAADANGDGLPDLVASWEQGGITRVYLAARSSPGRVTWKAITVGATPDAEDALLFDADGDGALDVISSLEGDARRLLVHWAPSADRYTVETAWRTETLHADGSRWMFAVPMDVDGRFGTDLVVGGKDEGASIGWLEAPPRPRNIRDWTFHRISEVGWTMSLVVRDMNGDGQADVLVSDRRGPLAGLRWLEHPGPDPGRLRAPWTNHWIGARGREAMLLDVGDVDGDRIPEVVLPHYLGPDHRLSIFSRHRGSPGELSWSERAVPYPALAGSPKSVAVGDLDLDGRADLVLSAENARDGKRGIVWLRRRGASLDAAWDAVDVSGPDGVKFDMNLLLDVDGDGDLDIVNSEERDNARGGTPGLGVVWYENPARW